MREIKFRGRAVTYTKELDDAWVYGSLIVNGNCPYIVGGPTEVNYDAEYYTLDHDRWAEVLPESVGQYTGLKDKNGREIYEGDILRHLYLHGARVNPYQEINNYRVYFRDAGYWDATNDDGERERKICYSVFISCEVIGNIFENPELVGPVK